MKTILITSEKFNGEVELRYDLGYLTMYESRAALSTKEIEWLLANLPLHENMIPAFIYKTKTLKVTEVKKEITFENFWDKYNHKAVSNKKKTQDRWTRMSKAKQAKAYYYIDTYFSKIPGGVAKKYAETYLNSEQWEQ